jgi:outer membrane protein TolC
MFKISDRHLLLAAAAAAGAWIAPLAAPQVGFAAESAAAIGRPDPLGALVDEAIRANLGLEQERLSERRSEAEVGEARALLLPSLTLDSRYSHLSGALNLGDLLNPAFATLNQLTGASRFPTDIDLTLPQRHDSRLRLAQPLFNETIRANFALARSRRDGQRLQLAAAARRLAAEVQVAYLQQASARRVAEIYQATSALVQENERVAERLLEAGRVTPEAVHRARAERAEVDQQWAEARERQRAAGRALNQILQRPLEAEVGAIPDSAFERPLDLTLDAAVTHALGGREELRQSDAGVRTATAARRVATAGYLPSAAVALDYGYQGRELALRDDEDYWSASVVVSWNLFDGGRDAARRAAAGYEIDRARASRRELAEQIELEVRNAHEAATVARAAIATADTRLESARRTYALVHRRYEEGAASPFELVDARTAMTSAELNRVLTAYRYAIRWVDLERAAALRDLPNEKGARP